jgi:hypothetical protein
MDFIFRGYAGQTQQIYLHLFDKFLMILRAQEFIIKAVCDSNILLYIGHIFLGCEIIILGAYEHCTAW